ncbi:MAG TPA: methyltransferase domain-containing protein [Halothiobacillaceae bacterium]|nr:methyltransferase domain-containing protein [Halothiobacillaceae bacterium]
MTLQNLETTTSVDRDSLEHQVKEMYRAVADEPHREYHFEMGRGLTERLGYPPTDLDRIPAAAVESFAGVGYFFDLAELLPGETVVDLGSGSGTDAFIAALKVGGAGRVIGIDMTDAQLAKAGRLRDAAGFTTVEYRKGYIERLPVADESVDAVISNGVINLSPDKAQVFRETARVLKPGGRLAIADIVTEAHLPEAVTCNADLWAACIGGAMQEDDYVAAIEAAGLTVVAIAPNTAYGFVSDSARGATGKWGVKSVSYLATKRG